MDTDMYQAALAEALDNELSVASWVRWLVYKELTDAGHEINKPQLNRYTPRKSK